MIVNRGIDKVNLGDFVQKVTILKPEQRRNKRGATEQHWVKVGDVFGKLVISAVDESMLDQNIVNQDRIELTTYVKNDMTSEYRLMIDGILYAVVSVAKLLNQPLMVIKGEKLTER